MTEQTTTMSYKPSEMSVEQLVQVNQGLGHQIDKLRADRVHIGKLIAQKLKDERIAALKAQIADLEAQVNAEAPGAVIEATAAAVS